MTDTKMYRKLWAENKMHILQSAQWHQVKQNSKIYIADNTPTLVLISNIPLINKPFAQVLRAGHTGLYQKTWLIGLKDQLLADYPELTHIYIEPNADYVQATEDLQPSSIKPINAQYTVINDLTLNEDDLLAACSKSHRQNIRKGKQKGLVVEAFTEGDEALNRFLGVMNAISTSKSFLQVNKQHYTNVWKTLSESSMAYISIGSFEGQDIGAYFVAHNGQTAYQFYGGRTKAGRDLKLAQSFAFETMLAAKSLGCEQYDMWGIGKFNQEGELDSTDELYGVGQFKTAFGGQLFKHSDSVVLVLNKSGYKLFKLLKKVKLLQVKLLKKWRR